MSSIRSFVPVLICAASIAAIGCSKHAPQSPSAAPAKSALAESYWLAAAPAGAIPVVAARERSKDGEPIVVTGRVKDFVDGLAAFTIVDASLPSCAEGGDMKECETPWDYCCTDPAAVQRASASVEIHDANGIVTTDVRGFHGLDHLKPVTVAGTAKRDAAGNLTVLAASLNVSGG